MRLFNFNTEEDNFSDFSVQELEEDGDQLLRLFFFLNMFFNRSFSCCYCCVTGIVWGEKKGLLYKN